MKKNFFKLGLFAMTLTMAACSQDDLSSEFEEIKDIVGVAQTPEVVNGFEATTRSVVKENTSDFSLLWAAGESIGVYGSSITNTKYTSTNKSNSESVTFSGGSLFKTPKYAYYPYSTNNNSIAQTAVKGELKQEQTWDASAMALAGDFKVGTYKSRSWTNTTFTFSNVLTYLKLSVDATGTVLEGDKLQKVTVTAGNSRQLWGAFQANLTKAAASALTWNGTESNSNVAALSFSKTPALEGAVAGYMVAAPSVKKGDEISFLVETDNHKASFTVTSGVDYAANLHVVYAMALAEMTDVVYMNADGTVIEDETEGDNTEGEPEGGENTGGNEGGDNTGTEGGDNTGTEGGDNTGTEGGDDNSGNTEGGDNNNQGTQTPVVPTVITGQFTCATYNVDGLPNKISFVSINSDGPGESGTKNISAKIAQQNWDFVGFSEDFAYHSSLISSLGTYQWGKHRGSISSSALYKTIDTDGLEFAARKTTCSWSEENITAFSSSYGGLTSGANTCIKKGFRHYPVTVAEGVVVDVIITHMNTYSSSGSGHINAQHAQLKQIAQYINELVAKNNRPVILMGDTNCRYTRHDFQTYFWSVLNSNLTYADPWVEFQWNGVYPTYPSKSLMVSDATGTNSSTDIICANTQQGEVVDKIIYINTPTSDVQIKALNYLRDYDNFNGLGDHMPIVSTFKFEKTVENSSNTSAAANYNSVVMNGGNAFGW